MLGKCCGVGGAHQQGMVRGGLFHQHHSLCRVLSAGGIALAVYGVYKLRATKPLQQLAHVLSINRRDNGASQ